MTGLTFDYYYGIQAEQFAFYRIPRLLVKDQHFKSLSSDAKLLYGLMLDRMTLSMKNRWLDDKNRAYIIYSISNVMEDLNCSKPTCIKIMKELDSFGLIERRRMGLGKPDIIYVKNFVLSEEEEKNGEEVEAGDEMTVSGKEIGYESENETDFESDEELINDEPAEVLEMQLPEVKKFNFCDEDSDDGWVVNDAKKTDFVKENEDIEADIVGKGEESELPEVKNFNFWSEKNCTSSGKKALPLEVKSSAPNYTENNYNNQSYNHINQSNQSKPTDQSCKDKIDLMDKTDVYIQQIKKNLDYDFYMTNDVAYMDKDLLKELFDLICDVVCAKSETIKISGDVYSRDYVRSKFLRLTSEHVMYVMDCIKNTTTKIANIKAYLLVALFNAPSTIGHYYQQEVKHYTDSDVQGVG